MVVATQRFCFHGSFRIGNLRDVGNIKMADASRAVGSAPLKSDQGRRVSVKTKTIVRRG